jgi:hypothetical protein
MGPPGIARLPEPRRISALASWHFCNGRAYYGETSIPFGEEAEGILAG